MKYGRKSLAAKKEEPVVSVVPYLVGESGL